MDPHEENARLKAELEQRQQLQESVRAQVKVGKWEASFFLCFFLVFCRACFWCVWWVVSISIDVSHIRLIEPVHMSFRVCCFAELSMIVAHDIIRSVI
jgi:hypothetical protein